MVKVDAKHDYYNDLELPPDATNDDIKRQFRKLALKYHPDRNPGQETDVIARFQAIQAAHEVLGEPAQKSEYDNERKKAALKNAFARPVPPRRGNPYQAQSDFPPPPSRTRPRNPPDAPPPPQASGATRYAQFAPPPQRQRERPRTWQDAQAKTNIFNTYQNMNPPQKPQTHTQRPGGHPVPPPFQESAQRPNMRPTSATFQRRPSDNSPPRSAYEEVNRPPPQPGISRAYSTRTPRRTNLDVDNNAREPPMANAAYAANVRFDRNNLPRMHSDFPPHTAPMPPPRPQAPTAKRPDHPQTFRTRSGDETPFTEGTGRQSTPYTSHIGEKTYFDSDALRRNATENDPRDHVRRHRSFSPISRTTSMKHDASTPSAGHKTAPPRPYVNYSSDEPSDDESIDSSPHGPPERDPASRPKAQPSASWTNRNGASPHTMPQNLEEHGNAEAGQSAGPRTERGSIFDFPRHDDQNGTEASRPRSMENINTKFTEEPVSFTSNVESSDGIHRTESHPDMTGLRRHVSHRAYAPSPIRSEVSGSEIPSQFQPPPRSNDAAWTTASDDNNLHAEPQSYPSKSAGAMPSSMMDRDGFFPPQHAPAESSEEDPLRRHESFSAESWSEQLKDGSWAERWANPQPETSPTRGTSQTAKRSRTSSNRSSRTGTKPPNVPKPATVSDNIEESAEYDSTRSNEYSDEQQDVQDDNAMDIDERTPPPNGPPHPTIVIDDQTKTDGARRVYVEPHRRDWQSATTPIDEAAPSPSTRPPNAFMPTSHPTTPNLGMSEFRNVAPFAPEDTGLKSMADLGSALPFTSQAAASTPLSPANRVTSILLHLPRPPVPPTDPIRLTEASWLHHLKHMRVYMTGWNAFNRRIVEILGTQAVRFCAMEQGPTGGMVEGWLSANGGTRELGGWDAYITALEDERRLREWWNVACDKHGEVVARHGRLRDRVLRGDMSTA